MDTSKNGLQNADSAIAALVTPEPSVEPINQEQAETVTALLEDFAVKHPDLNRTYSAADLFAASGVSMPASAFFSVLGQLMREQLNCRRLILDGPVKFCWVYMGNDGRPYLSIRCGLSQSIKDGILTNRG